MNTFGSADVIIAIHDRGIESNAAGVIAPLHGDFNGTVNGGQVTGQIGNNNKVYIFMDFNAFATNNSAPPNSHGVGCAGVATGLADWVDPTHVVDYGYFILSMSSF